MVRKHLLPLSALAVSALAGCPTRDISKIDPSPAIEYRQNINVSQNRNVDILFVIDNSNSMQQEQDSLARNFNNFINVLNGIEGGLPNIHIGVVSSDLGIGGWTSEQCMGVGDDGLLQSAARVTGCKPPRPPARFISDVAIAGGGRDKNYDGTLAETFSCIAQLGVLGCGAEQHLESMKLALDGSRTENQGFLRKDAYLAIVILADEDDCSTSQADVVLNPSPSTWAELGIFNSFRCTEYGVTCDGSTIARAAADYRNCTSRTDSFMNDPQKYFDFLKGLKGNPSLLIGAVIAGNPTPFGVGLTGDQMNVPNLKPSCQSANGIADPAVRLKDFVDNFADQGQFLSICQDDLSEAIETVAKLLARVLGTTCLQGDIDVTDLNNNAGDGLQIDCHVSDLRFRGQAGETEKSIPRCMMTNATTPVTTGLSAENPCWWVAENNAKCADSPTHLELKVERGGQDALIGTEVVARCIVNE